MADRLPVLVLGLATDPDSVLGPALALPPPSAAVVEDTRLVAFSSAGAVAP